MEITGDNDLGLEKYKLHPTEWQLLKDYREILEVPILFLNFNLMLTSNIRFLMHFRIFLVLKQHQPSVILFLLSQLSFKDGRSLQMHIMTGTE